MCTLNLVVERNITDVAELLMMHGADINAKDDVSTALIRIPDTSQVSP